MSSKPAVIRQRDVTRVVKGYAAAGIAVEMLVENGNPVFRPIDPLRAANEPSSSEPDAEEAYRRWKEGHAAG